MNYQCHKAIKESLGTDNIITVSFDQMTNQSITKWWDKV